MKVEEKGHTITITDVQNDTTAFLMKVTHEHKTFANHNIILDVSADAGLTLKDISQFKPLSKLHQKGRKSFVIVANGIDFNEVPQVLNVVPTLQEAHDLIEMEEIERDLGF